MYHKLSKLLQITSWIFKNQRYYIQILIHFKYVDVLLLLLTQWILLIIVHTCCAVLWRLRRLLLAVGQLSASNDIRANAAASMVGLLTSFKLLALAMTHWHSSLLPHWSNGLSLLVGWILLLEWLAASTSSALAGVATSRMLSLLEFSVFFSTHTTQRHSNASSVITSYSLDNISTDRLFIPVPVLWPLDAHCCDNGTAIKHPVPDWVKPSFVIFDMTLRVPGCQKIQMTT